MTSWFDINSLDPRLFSLDPPGIAESTEYVCGLVQKQIDAGIPPGRVILVGFSQGGAVAIAASLAEPSNIGGVLMLSTFLASSKLPPGIGSRMPPIHFFHGEAD